MNPLIHLLFYTCKRATLLLEMNHKGSASFIIRLKLKAHLYFCESCTRYQKQSAFIEQTLSANQLKTKPSFNLKLSDSSKIRIQKVFEEKLKKD